MTEDVLLLITVSGNQLMLWLYMNDAYNEIDVRK